MKTLLRALILALLLGAASWASNKTVEIATLDWGQYIGPARQNQGYVAEVVREAFALSGYEVRFVFYPWARVLHAMKKGEVAAYGPEYYSRNVARNYLLSYPFPGGPLVFFRRKGEPIEYDTLQDLTPYNIGVVRGYVNTDEFDKTDYLTKLEAVDDTANMRKLLHGRVDLVVMDKFVGYEILKQMGLDSMDEVDVVAPPLDEGKPLYLCFPKDNPQSRAYRAAFDKGLRELEQSGEIRRIAAEHGLNFGLTP